MSAACCGVTPAGRLSASCLPALPAGTVKWVAELDSLDQTQALVPLRTTSVSPSEPSRATRCLSSPAYQTREGVRAGQQRGQRGAAAADLGQLREAEVGILHHRAGQPVDARALQVDQQLAGTLGRQRRVRLGGEHAGGDGRDGRRRDDGRAPAEQAQVGRCSHEVILRPAY
jgi:hypothetical protein